MPRTGELLGIASGSIAQMALLDYDDPDYSQQVGKLARDWLTVIEQGEEFPAIEALFVAMGSFVAGTNAMMAFMIKVFADGVGLKESDPVVQEWLTQCNASVISAQLIQAAQDTRNLES